MTSKLEKKDAYKLKTNLSVFLFRHAAVRQPNLQSKKGDMPVMGYIRQTILGHF